MFIIESLSKKSDLYTIEPYIKDKQIYSIVIESIVTNKTIEFKCSYKLLNTSLMELAIPFNLKEKMIFPYKFASQENLNYIEDILNSTFFNDEKSHQIFKKINKKILNFKILNIILHERCRYNDRMRRWIKKNNSNVRV